MKDTKWLTSMINMMWKDAIELVISELGKSETYPVGNGLLENGIYKYLYRPSEQHGHNKDKLITLSGVKIRTD